MGFLSPSFAHKCRKARQNNATYVKADTYMHSCRLGQVNFIVPSLVADGNQDIHISLTKRKNQLEAC